MSFKTGQLRIIRTLFILFFYVITCAISQGQVLKNEKDFMQVVRHTKQKTTLSTLKNSEFLTSQMDKSRNNVALRAKQAQIENLQGAKTEISALCLNHTEILLEALVSKQQWAMRCKYLLDNLQIFSLQLCIFSSLRYTMFPLCTHESY